MNFWGKLAAYLNRKCGFVTESQMEHRCFDLLVEINPKFLNLASIIAQQEEQIAELSARVGQQGMQHAMQARKVVRAKNWSDFKRIYAEAQEQP